MNDLFALVLAAVWASCHNNELFNIRKSLSHMKDGVALVLAAARESVCASYVNESYHIWDGYD